MKKLSETLTELGIAFSFPIEIEDANGNETYYENSDDFWYRYEYDANGKWTYFENGDNYWERRELDAKGKETYCEYSDGTKRGTPRSAKASIILDEEESIRFAEMLKAAPTPPTPEFKRALQAYRDFIIGHIQ